MQNGIYLGTETMSALVILILIYANNFEIKQRSKKRSLFNGMLIINEVVVLSDVVTYFPFPWHKMTFLFHILMVAAYTLPTVLKMFFSSYLHVHIAAKTPVDKKPFVFMRFFCLVEFIIIFLLCVSGKMFYIEDGAFYSGSAEIVYLIVSIFSMLAFTLIVFGNAKKIGFHDTVVVLPFMVIPLLSLVILVFTGLNLTITMMAINVLVMYVTLQSEHESFLFDKANIDELTGLYNRAAYEEDIQRLSKAADDTLCYASVDLNGLKAANDSLGHAAGDELIRGAAYCLRQAFGGAGKVFRTGGDEFAAIFFVDENNYKFEILKEALQVFTKEWKGNIVDSLTLSVGYASKKEFPDENIVGLSKIADKRMYADKSRYYASKGVDRRGQNNAYRVLLRTRYTKILEINITDDRFTVIEMFDNEQRSDKGYSESIFEWFSGFAKSGQVHPDDREDFLSKTSPDYMCSFFKSGNRLLELTYRRKYGDDFKPAIMEIIPTNEYTDDNQSLYLYVKNVGEPEGSKV